VQRPLPFCILAVGGGNDDVGLIRLRFCLAISGVLVFSKIDLKSSSSSCSYFNSVNIVVDDVAGEPGFYSVSMSVVPHFKYMGADFTLSLRGKLDKS
jgi:hypothetical protein